MNISNEDFDDDSFICEALENQKSAKKTNKFIDVSSLISGPRLNNLSTTRLCFDQLKTPKNENAKSRDGSRRQFVRRCLSTDLNNDFSSENVFHFIVLFEHFNIKISFFQDEKQTFQDFRHSKETKRTLDSFSIKNSGILSSIENTISPNNYKNVDNSINLTPEFNFNKKPKLILNEATSLIQSKANNLTVGVPLQKCFSENHASIMRAVQISSSDPSLIGDFSKSHILPLLKNFKHQDLKSISCHVLVDILNGHYNDVIESFSIVDCRYPYEYEGGHIKTAVNLYTQELILNHFIKNKTGDAVSKSTNKKRHILIFHCEFSSERGPSL